MKRSTRQWLAERLRIRSREEGVALVSVVVVLVVMATSAADFAFNTTMDLVGAANARDDLRAHYLARSSMNLSRLLLHVQRRFIDPHKKFLGGMDIQIADYAPMLISAFNSKEGAEMLGSLFGVEGSSIKGLGVDVGTFDLEMSSLDGKLNLNCAGGANPGNPAVIRTASSLAALMLPDRYNRIFEDPDENGQYTDRLEMMRAIIDWVDQDTVIFGTSSAVEDYRYNTGKDPYENKNQYFDSLEELRLVKGVDEDFMNAFEDRLTVYGGCKVNVNLADPMMLASIIVQNAKTANDPALGWENLILLVTYIKYIRDFYGGFADFKSFVQAVEEPLEEAAKTFSWGTTLSSSSSGSGVDTNQLKARMLPALGVELKEETLKDAVVVGGSRRIWKITATAEVGRIKKKITAIWDTLMISMQSGKYNLGPGGFLHWREE